VDFRTQINIPTNNAGSSAINLTLPAVLSGMRGCANGRKVNVGKSVMGSMFGGVMSIVHYDNTYPGGDGTDITMSGVFELP